MILSGREAIDIVAMSFIVGFILKDIFMPHKRATVYEPLDQFKKKWTSHGLLFATLVTAPAIILHELGHKFLAMHFGMAAVFKAAYTWLGIGFLLKLFTGFIFFVPAYVEITNVANATPLQFSLVAFAGPAVNLVLWLTTWFVYTRYKIKQKYMPFLVLTSKINMLLFIFNMLPIPGFDGFKVYSGIFQTLVAL
ncbi:M50 family metallopeptidase [Candidatus Woesearchaeota archaeon]|nr:M50 family metallopeptidase [Candidatus Woesearchaeota archaeon]MBW3021918.1 M50 family metallopeptidase [Candidatus Woesearchaeota archaeon]